MNTVCRFRHLLHSLSLSKYCSKKVLLLLVCVCGQCQSCGFDCGSAMGDNGSFTYFTTHVEGGVGRVNNGFTFDGGNVSLHNLQLKQQANKYSERQMLWTMWWNHDEETKTAWNIEEKSKEGDTAIYWEAGWRRAPHTHTHRTDGKADRILTHLTRGSIYSVWMNTSLHGSLTNSSPKSSLRSEVSIGRVEGSQVSDLTVNEIEL